MNKGEVSELLAVITDMWATLTPRTEDDARLRINNWSAALDADIPHKFAVTAVHKHFGVPGSREPTPGIINKAWRDHKRDEHHRRTMSTIRATGGIPPTPEFYAAWEQLKQRQSATTEKE